MTGRPHDMPPTDAELTAAMLDCSIDELPESLQAAHVVQRTAQRREVEALAERERAELAIITATRVWSGLARTSVPGRAYLATRGLGAEYVSDLERRDLVRYRTDGSPAVALHDSIGRIWSVVTRWVTPRSDAKVTGLRGCPTSGTLVGYVGQIVGGVDVVLAEGVIDSLVAAVAYPAAVILGAHGCARYPQIARAVVPQIRLARGRLLLAVDCDDPGTAAGCAAIDIALAGGLVHRRTAIVIQYQHAAPNALDLADAWRDGWRP